MTRLRTLTVGDECEGMRLDQFVGSQPDMGSRSAAVRAIEAGRVLVDGEAVLSKKYVLAGGETVVVELEEPKEQSDVPLAEDIPLDIRFEDDQLLVISKQRGLVCHPASGHAEHTLVNALVAHCGLDNLGTLQGPDRAGIVHRLDLDTTGLMLAAKTDTAQDALQEAIRSRSVDRRYIALVHGVIGQDSGLVDAPIARSNRDRLRMAVIYGEGSRPSVTTFKVIERFDPGRKDEGYTLMECKLLTGRTHQIRVHMNYINHAVVGDPVYGHGDAKQNLCLDRQFLHSWSLRLKHPATGEELLFCDHPARDLWQAYEGLKERSRGVTLYGERVLQAIEQAPMHED